MAFHFLLIISLLNLVFAGSHAALPEEVHWKSVFPNTPMPKALKDLLPPAVGAFDYRASSGELKSGNAPINPFIIYETAVTNQELKVGAFDYRASSGELKSGNAPINPFIIYETAVTNKELKGQSTIFRGQDAPDQKGINDPEFGAYWYGDNAGKNFKGEDAPSNKGVHDPEFGAYWYGDNSNKESKGEYAPTNKGVNDPEFGAYAYDSEYKGSVKESKGENAPSNKGPNDPEFGNYAYDSEYKGSVKESRGENAPSNKGPNDPEFGNYDSEYDGSVKESKGNINSSGRKSNIDNTAVKETIYFFQKDLLPGKKVNLPRLVQKRDRGTFLPHHIAESMPLSSDKLPEILKNFSLKAESRDANNVKITIKNCERAEMKGEEKYCATSLESFVDMSVSMLGKEIQLLSNELRKETKDILFTITRGVRNMGENDIVCHKMKYPYAVYLCHSIKKTTVYKVPLVGTDGTKANAVAVCHKDTSAWSPNHIAFKVLKVKPGTIPICHFLGRDTLVWVPN